MKDLMVTKLVFDCRRIDEHLTTGNQRRQHAGSERRQALRRRRETEFLVSIEAAIGDQV